ncbi:hypothetical protein JTE90_006650 [Oedothorax gibbosus]|uniref:Mutator-like transposase domain-containing protein n=1 Tax=Oedothorax gibbosus TaxID=931172 RepID=A0AAV6TR46_9ARAC|nr:hypothetical protein JTE90_006650 [Oedothorax gibbosus]
MHSVSSRWRKPKGRPNKRRRKASENALKQWQDIKTDEKENHSTDDEVLSSDAGNVTSDAGNVTSDAGNVTSDAGIVTSDAGIVRRETGVNINEGSGAYTIMDQDMWSSLLKNVTCSECSSNSMQVITKSSFGLSNNLELTCGACGHSYGSTFSSNRSSLSKKFDVNNKFVRGFLSIGRGYAALETFSMILGIPAINRKTFSNCLNELTSNNPEVKLKVLQLAWETVRSRYIELEPSLADNDTIDISVTYDDLTLNSFDLSAERQECVQWFLETRSNSSVNKWGTHLPRTAVALYLSNADYFAPENKTGQEIRYELTIHLLSTLNRHEILRTEKLTMYVLAMLVSCLNPRNFFNHDIVSELRKRVDISKYTNPLAILALCNAGAPMTDQDVERLNETYNSHHRIYWTEVQVISTLALSCISSKTNVSVDQEILNQWVDSAKKYLLKDKSAINPRTAALIIQLMLSTNYPTEFNWIAAFRAITNPTFVRSSNILDKYYLTPILSNKGLNAIDNKHCHYKNDLLFNSNRDAIVVRYTVRAEKDVSLGKSWSIKVPPSSTLYDVMTTVQALDATHTLQFNIVDGKPYIRSVSGLAEDPEYDNYWFTYVRTQEVSPGSRLLEESPVDVTVSNDDEFIIWYRNAIWKTSSYGSGEHP